MLISLKINSMSFELIEKQFYDVLLFCLGMAEQARGAANLLKSIPLTTAFITIFSIHTAIPVISRTHRINLS